jgi:protein Mpv17
MTALVVANYFLWPLTRYLNNTFVPAEHRVTANHIITVVWNAWLSTLGHAPQVDPTDLLHRMGGESLLNHVSEHMAPALADAGAAVSNAVSPFVHQATVGVAALADRMPSCLLEKAFSKSLDILSPFSGVERSPSQLLEAAASIHLDRTGTLELVLDRLQSARL